MPKKPELSPEDQALRERIGLSIRAVSAMRGKKPADLMAAGGISQAQQYRIEGGEAAPDAIYLVKVAAYLGVSLDELCGAQVQGTTSPKRVAKQTPTPSAGGGSMYMDNSGSGNQQVGHAGGDVLAAGAIKASGNVTAGGINQFNTGSNSTQIGRIGLPTRSKRSP